MKYFLLTLMASALLFKTDSVSAQKRKINIALFTSLYLDETFDSAGLPIKGKDFPKQAIPGLEFYEGATMAVDTLNKTGIAVGLRVLDVQTYKDRPSSNNARNAIEFADIVIAQVPGTEMQQLAALAVELKKPIINATYPNDKGVRNNPYVYMANPRIHTHLEFLYSQLKTKWPQGNTIWMKRKDGTDDLLESMFLSVRASDPGTPLNIKTQLVDPSTLQQAFSSQIDTTKMNLIIAGSLDEEFSLTLAKAILAYPKKAIVQFFILPGMENNRELQKPVYYPISLWYTTPFYIPQYNAWAKFVDEYIRSNTFVKASPSVYKGFELVYYFTSLFSKHGHIRVDDPTDQLFKLMNDYQFKPTRATGSQAGTVDYFENKKIYLLKRINGTSLAQ